MSENVTHTAVLDDCFRLMLASDQICPAFKAAGREHHEFAQLGSITRWGDRFTVKLLADHRAAWPDRTPEALLEPKLAFVLGWLCHRAADRQMKPLFRQADPEGRQKPTECSIYQDAFLFREVYASGKAAPYHPAMFEKGLESLPAASWMDAPAVEELFHVLLQRSLLQLHTFIPNGEDVEGWLDRLFSLRQRFSVDLKRYAAAVAGLDDGTVQRFVEESGFYDRGAPIIAAARALDRGEAIEADALRMAAGAEARSHYAQALKLGFGYLRAASDFFTSDMTPEELSRRLDIGSPGRDGHAV